MKRMTDQEFLTELKADLEGASHLLGTLIDAERLARLQVVIDRLAPDRLIAAVRAYEDHVLRGLDE